MDVMFHAARVQVVNPSEFRLKMASLKLLLILIFLHDLLIMMFDGARFIFPNALALIERAGGFLTCFLSTNILHEIANHRDSNEMLSLIETERFRSTCNGG